MIAGILHDHSHAVAGVVAFAVFASAALAQILLGRSPRRGQAAIGLTAMLAGLALVTASVWMPSFWLLLIGGIVAGGGAGAAFRGMVGTVISITPAEVRGEGLAGLFLGTYLGMMVTVVGVGVATLWVSLQVAVLGFAILLAVMLVLVARRVLTS
jgi:MFS family permease